MTWLKSFSLSISAIASFFRSVMRGVSAGS